MDDRTSDGFPVPISASREDFNQRAIDRDRACVLTGSTGFGAFHIIPHAKGDSYITNLANHRNQFLDPPLSGINDTRNGILLTVLLHPALGSEVAFLRTPNFAMSVNDVDLVTQHTASSVSFSVHPSTAQRRLTIQHFSIQDFLVPFVTPQNCDGRPLYRNDWPPPFIFDVAYGYAALKKFILCTTMAERTTTHNYPAEETLTMQRFYGGKRCIVTLGNDAHWAHMLEAALPSRNPNYALPTPFFSSCSEI